MSYRFESTQATYKIDDDKAVSAKNMSRWIPKTSQAPSSSSTLASASSGSSDADWEATFLPLAVDWAWSTCKSDPEVFLKHTLAVELVARRQHGAGPPKLASPEAGKQRLFRATSQSACLRHLLLCSFTIWGHHTRTQHDAEIISAQIETLPAKQDIWVERLQALILGAFSISS